MKCRPSMSEEKKMKLTYVYDIVRDEKRWVETRYVQMYPNMYTPVQYKGIVIESEIVDVKPYH